MRVVMFYHSILSDWNHGNAHFLRGVAGELSRRGHAVAVYEPADSWSRLNLEKDHGRRPIARFHARYPGIDCRSYALDTLDLDGALRGADVVLVHEWNDPDLVRRIGRHRAGPRGNYRLFFHDTHHRAVTAPHEMARYDLRHYDGVLAFGAVLRNLYLRRGWARKAWTWHEAADVRVFRPIRAPEPEGDLVWIGNWGDGERTDEIEEFLLGPSRQLKLRSSVFGVRYPPEGRRALARAGVAYRGWLPNFDVPATFGRFRVTIHVPRRPYVRILPGIPTIRPFEALACGIPLISAPWKDAEGLFAPGREFLVATDGREMRRSLKAVLESRDLARELSERGLATIRARHTCAHRVDELLSLCDDLVVRRRRSGIGNRA